MHTIAYAVEIMLLVYNFTINLANINISAICISFIPNYGII